MRRQSRKAREEQEERQNMRDQTMREFAKLLETAHPGIEFLAVQEELHNAPSHWRWLSNQIHKALQK
jgi:hypothetical protein